MLFRSPPNGVDSPYEFRFVAPGAGTQSASLGFADSPFTNGPQRIGDIIAASGSNLQQLNLPIDPQGAIYNAVTRTAVNGATVRLIDAVTQAPLSASCFDDPNQQNQITATDGFYKFDLNFSQADCVSGGDYMITVSAPADGYMQGISRIIPAASDVSTQALDVPACEGGAYDAVPSSIHCEVQTSAYAPAVSSPPRSQATVYYLRLRLSNKAGANQVYNNPIPLDPSLDGATAIRKTTPMVNVTRSQLVPYTITVSNQMAVPLYDMRVVDSFPAGFKYVQGSARINGVATEPQVAGQQLNWDNLILDVNASQTINLLLIVGGGVGEGEYINRAQAYNALTGGQASGQASATVRVVPDPTFDCSDLIGKVYDDRNLNGYQDHGESGLAGVRIVTVRGLQAVTDANGRFHFTCVSVPNRDRGSNLIVKVDDRSLPTGYRISTENPRVQRATRGKMLKFNFGASIHRVVRLDMADAVFEPNSAEMRPQWRPRLDLLLAQLKKAPSVLRLSYLAELESQSLVNKRLRAVKKQLTRRWQAFNCCYRLSIETEIFWRRGGPVGGGLK